MDGNSELLNYVYQNSQMGEKAIDQIEEVADNAQFRTHLRTQREEYENINREAKRMLHESGHEEKDIGAMEKISSTVMIGARTLTDTSTTHLAEMLVKGSTMGIIDATKNIKKYGDATENALSLAKKLLYTEESNVEHLKEFLS